MPEILFTSDLHLGHTNILEACNRPFASIEEMNEDLIERWNQKVSAESEVYILGDLSWRSQVDVSIYLEKMKGKKHLIIGNHDYKLVKNLVNPENILNRFLICSLSI